MFIIYASIENRRRERMSDRKMDGQIYACVDVTASCKKMRLQVQTGVLQFIDQDFFLKNS